MQVCDDVNDIDDKRRGSCREVRDCKYRILENGIRAGYVEWMIVPVRIRDVYIYSELKEPRVREVIVLIEGSFDRLCTSGCPTRTITRDSCVW